MEAAPIFRPTMEEFRDFSSYIDKIFPQVVPFGICKIIPPPGWLPLERPEEKYSSIDNLVIPSPIQQVLQGQKGCFEALNVEQNPMTIATFRTHADKAALDGRINDVTVEELERKFWKNVQFNPPYYGADMSGSLFDPVQKVWNPQDLGTALNLIAVDMAGINKPYLYFGMWKAMFAWHTEGPLLPSPLPPPVACLGLTAPLRLPTCPFLLHYLLFIIYINYFMLF